MSARPICWPSALAQLSGAQCELAEKGDFGDEEARAFAAVLRALSALHHRQGSRATSTVLRAARLLQFAVDGKHPPKQVSLAPTARALRAGVLAYLLGCDVAPDAETLSLEVEVIAQTEHAGALLPRRGTAEERMAKYAGAIAPLLVKHAPQPGSKAKPHAWKPDKGLAERVVCACLLAAGVPKPSRFFEADGKATKRQGHEA